MMLVKATLMAALLGMALGDQHPYTPYDPVQHNFGVRQAADIDPLVASLGIGALNAGYTTVVALNNAAKTRDVCNKMNEVLNVGNLGTVVTTAANKADIDIALAVIVAKINEILDKSTLSC